MKIHAILITLILFAHGAFSQTFIKNGEKVFGTWKKSNSPYIIQGEAIVPAGKTLKIKKGVTVKFKTGYSRDYRTNGVMSKSFDVGFLRVNGKIIAKATDSDPILFTRDGVSGNWGNVFIDSKDDGNYFKYCIFEYAHFIRGITESDNSTGSLTFYSSKGTAEYCTFRNNAWTALNCKQYASPTFKNLTIVRNKYGLECNSNSAPKVFNCIIWSNETPFYVNGDANPEVSYSLLQDRSLEYSYDKGNNIYSQDPMFMNLYQDDYSLRNGSPCIKTGKGKENMGSE